MSEVFHPIVELSAQDLAQAQRLLGYDIVPTTDLRPGQYDERLTIAQAALEAQEELRSALGQEVEALTGFAVSHEELAAWSPSEAQEATIRESLTGERIRARALDSLHAFIADGRMTDRSYGTPLRWNQQDMMVANYNFASSAPRNLPKGGKGGYNDSPPGTGKTGVIAKLCAGLKYNEDPNERVKIIVIENTIRVAEQTVGIDGTQGFGRFAPQEKVGLRHTFDKNLDEDITVMPAASVVLLMKEGKMPDAHFVIADEADTYANEYLAQYSEGKMVFCFSGTIDEKTHEMFPHQIYSKDTQTAIHQRLLAPTTAELLDDGLIIDESTLPDDPKERRDAIKARHVRARIDDLLERIPAHVEAGQMVLIHCGPGEDIAIAKQVARELRGKDVVVPNDGSWSLAWKNITRKVKAIEVGGSQHASAKGKRLQGIIFERFTRRDGDVLVYVRAVNRGFDCPALKVYYDISLEDEGWREKKQGAGRVMRLVELPDGTFEQAYLFGYRNPYKPDAYSFVQMLGGEPGQSSVRVEHSSRATGGERPSIELIAASAATRGTVVLDQVSVTHGEEMVEPAEEVILTPKNAADHIGVSLGQLSEMYKRVGFETNEAVTPNDLIEMINLLLQPLPDSGYISDKAMMARLGISDQKITRFRLLARYRDIVVYQFVADNRAGFYFSENDEQALREAFGIVDPPDA